MSAVPIPWECATTPGRRSLSHTAQPSNQSASCACPSGCRMRARCALTGSSTVGVTTSAGSWWALVTPVVWRPTARRTAGGEATPPASLAIARPRRARNRLPSAASRVQRQSLSAKVTPVRSMGRQQSGAGETTGSARWALARPPDGGLIMVGALPSKAGEVMRRVGPGQRAGRR